MENNEAPNAAKTVNPIDPLEKGSFPLGAPVPCLRQSQRLVFPAVCPPSTASTAPVTNEASALARNRAAAAISSARPSRLTGRVSPNAFRPASSSKPRSIGVSVGPGAMQIDPYALRGMIDRQRLGEHGRATLRGDVGDGVGQHVMSAGDDEMTTMLPPAGAHRGDRGARRRGRQHRRHLVIDRRS